MLGKNFRHGATRVLLRGVLVLALATGCVVAGGALSRAYAGTASGTQVSKAAWEDIQGVKVEVDGHDTGKTVTLKSGSASAITNDVLPKDLPRRENMQFVEAFVVIGDARYAVSYLGGRDGKVYYALKGEDMAQDLVVTSVSSGSQVVLSFQDKTTPLNVTVDVGNNSNVEEADAYSVIGLGDKELSGQGHGQSGAFKIAPGDKRAFMLEKQVAQEISITAKNGTVTKLSGGNDDATQTWEYKAPDSGVNDSLNITAKGTSRSFQLKAEMVMPGETLGGGIPGRPQSNRMFGNTLIAGYQLDRYVGVKDWGPGTRDAFVDPSQKNAVPKIELTANRMLSTAERRFVQAKGEHHGANHGAMGSGPAASVSGTIDMTFNRERRGETTILIDMVTTRCTPGNQGWAPQLGGVTVNGTAIPLKGFDYTTVGGPNDGQSLDARVSDWVTLDGVAKGTKVRVVGLGAWQAGKYSDDPSLGKWEFHHYVVELKDVTGPVDVKGIYITTANARVLNVGSYGVDTELSQREEGGSIPLWRGISVGGSLQAKNMMEPNGKLGASDVRIMAQRGYTLDGAIAKRSTTGENPGTENLVLEAKDEWVNNVGRSSNRYGLPAPDGSYGYSYFYTAGTLVNYGVAYDPNGGSYLEAPVDEKLYNVEGLTTITVEPHVPYKVDSEGTWTFRGYDIYDGDSAKEGTALKTGVQPGDTVKLADLPLKDKKQASRKLVFKAMWDEPATKGTTVTATVDFDMQAPDGTSEGTLQKSVLLAKGSEYEFVNIPSSYEHNGKVYLLDEAKSTLKPGTAATTDGQSIGKAVYVRYGDGVLDGATNLDGTKRVTGKDAPALKGGEFTFQIASTTQGAPMPAQTTVTNKADGAFNFGDITFTATGTYAYEITELPQGPQHYTFDAHKRTITVEVTNPDKVGGNLVCKVKSENGSKTFTNEYHKPDPKPVALDGEKYLAGTKKLVGKDAPQLAPDQFTFEITATSPNTPMPGITTATNDEHGAFNFGGIVYQQPGTYTYEVRELPGADQEITYDDTVHTVKVVVSEPEVHGEELRLAVKDHKPLDFTNTFTKLPDYTPGTLSGEGNLFGAKRLVGEGAPALRDGQFGFTIAPVTDGAPMPEHAEVRNDARGAFSFGDITFTQPGRYEYVITETPGVLPHYEYSDNEARIAVTVTEDPSVKNEPLTCKAELTSGSREFVNVYHRPAPGTLALPGGTVRLEGERAPQLKGGEFAFRLRAVSAPEGVEAPVESTVVSSDVDGAFDFGKLTFEDPGTYVFEVMQLAGPDERIGYDTHVATLTVTVREPGAAVAVARAVVEGDPSKVPYEVTCEVEGSLEYVNTFTPRGATVLPGIPSLPGLPATGDASSLLALAPWVVVGIGLVVLGIKSRRK